MFIEGRLAGRVENEGYGNACGYEAVNKEGLLLIESAEKYCAELPDVNYSPVYGDDDIILKSSLKLVLDREFEQHLIVSQHVDFEVSKDRNMLKGIIYGGPDEKAYSIFDSMITAGEMQRMLKKMALKEHVIPRLKKGMVVLNKNISESVLIGVGLSANQCNLNNSKIVKKQQKGRRI